MYHIGTSKVARPVINHPRITPKSSGKLFCWWPRLLWELSYRRTKSAGCLIVYVHGKIKRTHMKGTKRKRARLNSSCDWSTNWKSCLFSARSFATSFSSLMMVRSLVVCRSPSFLLTCCKLSCIIEVHTWAYASDAMAFDTLIPIRHL